MSLKPTNTYFKPEHATCMVTTRKKAQRIADILTKDFPRESAFLVPRINYELSNRAHDTHVAFYINDDSIDEMTVLQLVCLQLIFTHIVIGG